jgi:REP element-mobilizing transposase RayT
MPRTPRMVISGEPTAYHIISRTALDGYVLGDVERDFFVTLLKQKAAIYFTEIIGYCVMGNHFHLLARMLSDSGYTDKEIIKRYQAIHGEESLLPKERIGYYREKWSSLSEFVKELKQEMSRFYNKRHDRKGFFWGDRFKSLIVENGNALINCLAYIDLNPVRAGLVKRPEDYRWSSIGYHVQTGNAGGLLSVNYGLRDVQKLTESRNLSHYRRFLYETGAVEKGKGVKINQQIVEKERSRDFKITRPMRFRYRTRYFTDSGIIGTKEFVSETYQRFKAIYPSAREKLPKAISGLDGLYSLKRLSEAIWAGQ